MRILLVDDDVRMKTSTAFRLQKYGKVDMAETYAEAASLIDQHAHDILVVDQVLPGGLGTQLIEAAKIKNPFSCSILISGMLSVELCCEAMEKGCLLCLEKPFSISKLEDYVGLLIKRREAIREHLVNQMARVVATVGQIDLSAASIALAAYKRIDD